jgi:hypothetical protein
VVRFTSGTVAAHRQRFESLRLDHDEFWLIQPKLMTVI